MLVENNTSSYYYLGDADYPLPAGGSVTVPDDVYNNNDSVAKAINSLDETNDVTVSSAPTGYPRTISSGGGSFSGSAADVTFTPAGTVAATDVQAAIEEVATEGGGGGGAPTDVNYLVGTASGSLSAEIVVGTTPGGELGGTWASPTVDATHSGSSHASVQSAAEATAQAALDAHTGDTSDAHDASAISAVSTTLVGVATDVQGVLEELDNGIADHLADTSAAHAASAISADSTTLVGTGTDVQAVLEELDNGIADHLADTTDAHAGTAITNTPAGNVAATTVQGAINELDSEKTTAAAALTAAQTEIADQKRTLEILVSDPNGSAITTGDGKAYVRIPTLLNGHNLVSCGACLSTVSSSGVPTVQLRRMRLTNATTQSAADMLSTKLTIDASEFDSKDATNAAVIDTSNDDVQTGDQINIDIDVAGTGAKGLIVTLTFEAP